MRPSLCSAPEKRTRQTRNYYCVITFFFCFLFSVRSFLVVSNRTTPPSRSRRFHRVANTRARRRTFARPFSSELVDSAGLAALADFGLNILYARRGRKTSFFADSIGFTRISDNHRYCHWTSLSVPSYPLSNSHFTGRYRIKLSSKCIIYRSVTFEGIGSSGTKWRSECDDKTANPLFFSYQTGFFYSIEAKIHRQG